MAAVESDAGEPEAAGMDEVGDSDADFAAAGATVTADAINGAEIVLQVRRP